MEALRAYRESALTGDNPVRLVILLYDQLLRDFQRAIDALEKEDVETRCINLDHALVVLAQLQGTLDLGRGGEVASNLDRFYDLVRGHIVRASMDGSAELLKQQWSQILNVREAWLQVEQETLSQPPATPSMAADVMSESDTQRSSQWKA